MKCLHDNACSLNSRCIKTVIFIVTITFKLLDHLTNLTVYSIAECVEEALGAYFISKCDNGTSKFSGKLQGNTPNI